MSDNAQIRRAAVQTPEIFLAVAWMREESFIFALEIGTWIRCGRWFGCRGAGTRVTDCFLDNCTLGGLASGRHWAASRTHDTRLLFILLDHGICF